MNDLIKQQLFDDCREILKTEAGKRVFGRIFYVAGLNNSAGWPGSEVAAYAAGKHDMGLALANTLREVNAYAVADCEAAYADFIRKYERSDDDGGDGNDDL